MEKMMKQMGIKSEEIEADAVIIKTKGKDIIINNPQIMKVTISGQDTFQITGSISEKKRFSKEDIKLIAQQANVDEDVAKRALEEEGDIAAAILKLKG